MHITRLKTTGGASLTNWLGPSSISKSSKTGSKEAWLQLQFQCRMQVEPNPNLFWLRCLLAPRTLCSYAAQCGINTCPSPCQCQMHLIDRSPSCNVQVAGNDMAVLCHVVASPISGYQGNVRQRYHCTSSAYAFGASIKISFHQSKARSGATRTQCPCHSSRFSGQKRFWSLLPAVLNMLLARVCCDWYLSPVICSRASSDTAICVHTCCIRCPAKTWWSKDCGGWWRRKTDNLLFCDGITLSRRWKLSHDDTLQRVCRSQPKSGNIGPINACGSEDCVTVVISEVLDFPTPQPKTSLLPSKPYVYFIQDRLLPRALAFLRRQCLQLRPCDCV